MGTFGQWMQCILNYISKVFRLHKDLLRLQMPLSANAQTVPKISSLPCCLKQMTLYHHLGTTCLPTNERELSVETCHCHKYLFNTRQTDQEKIWRMACFNPGTGYRFTACLRWPLISQFRQLFSRDLSTLTVCPGRAAPQEVQTAKRSRGRALKKYFSDHSAKFTIYSPPFSAPNPPSTAQASNIARAAIIGAWHRSHAIPNVWHSVALSSPLVPPGVKRGHMPPIIDSENNFDIIEHNNLLFYNINHFMWTNFS